MKNKGQALVEMVLCLWMSVFFFTGTMFLRHIFRMRSGALAVVSLGNQLAAHPDLSEAQRESVLKRAAAHIMPCPMCRTEIINHRFLDTASSRFYDFAQTRVQVQLGHEKLLRFLSLPGEFSESSVVLKEPSHENP